MTQLTENASRPHEAAAGARHASLGMHGHDAPGARTSRATRMALELAVVGLAIALVLWVSYAVLRTFSIDRLWCLLGAVLFSCAPYHFLRLEHLLLASYLSVPLAIWLAARVFQSRGPADLSALSALATIPVGLSIVATGS